MSFTKFKLIILLVFCTASYSFSQINGYTFSTSTGATLEDMSSGTTQLIAGSIDDNVSAVTNIGFSFFFNCTNVTQFSVNSNGLMRLGSTAVTSSFSNSLANGSNDPKLAPFWDDLSTGSVASGGKVHYKLVGSAPNRYLVVEWLVNVPYSVGSPYNGRFQVHLFETTGVIKYVYGTVPTGTSYSVGMATSSTDYISVTTTTNTASTSSVNNSQTAAITSGRVYTFTPGAGSGNMTYSSNTTMQASIADVTKCSTSQAIIAVKVVTTGCASSISLTQLQFTMNGSSSPLTDVSKIHVYYTGNVASYTGINVFDGVGTNPAAGTITVNGSQNLVGGDNYFWIVYDISTGATVGNVVDATCTSITVDGTSYTPTVQSPNGNRTIIACPTTLIASYPLTSGNADVTTNYGNMTNTGTATSSASGICNGGVYSSSTNYASTPNLSTLTSNSFQIEVDFSMNSFNHPIIVGGNGYRWIELKVNAGGYMVITYNNGTTLTSNTSISLSTTYTAKLMYYNGTVELFLNDVLIYYSNALPSPLTTGNDLDFWITNFSNGTTLDGCIQNLEISNLSFIAPPSALPVKLIDFNTECDGERVELIWSTASEINNDYFTVEKSLNGYTYEKVDNVEGAGNSNYENYYSYIDPVPYTSELIYYRLSQTDYDGHKEYLKIIATECIGKNSELKIISTVKQGANVQLNFISPTLGDHSIHVQDELGKIVAQKTVHVESLYNSIPLEFEAVQSLYIVTVLNNSNKAVKKFLLL